MAGFRDNLARQDFKPVRKARIPDGYESESEFLSEMRERYEEGYSCNEHNILAGKEDARFVAGDQWDSHVAQRRQNMRKPVLTFNRLVAFVAQVVGNRLINETEIRVFPEKQGTRTIAEIREGIIRSIFRNSYADFARDEAAKYQVICGEGYFTLSIEYVSDDVFEQEIRINSVTDPYSVVMDPLSIEPSGADAQWAFVGEDIPLQEFKRRWPWAAQVGFDMDTGWNRSGLWARQDNIRVVTYWQMVTEGIKVLALYQDGSVHDVTDMDEADYMPFVETRSDGTPLIREVPNRFARLYVCSGNAILEGPYDYPMSSIPVYRVSGWELNDGERTHRWGLVRFLKDPQRLHNYWRSTIAEQLVAAPRNKWLTTPDAVRGHEARWRRAAVSDDPFLFFNDGEQPPVNIPPPRMDGALVNEAVISTQDMKDISNIHEAALGMPSNEVSGVAIQQRQMVSDVGTYIYIDRRRLADERCARNINELIPYIYDTKRTLTVIGRDDKEVLMTINDPMDPNSDVLIGKYGVTVSVGPASQTKRTLAAEQMMAFVNANPAAAALVMDLIAEAQDWPKAGEFAKRFRSQLPPGMVSPDDMTPEMQAAQQQVEQVAQMEMQLKQMQIEAELAAKAAKAASDEARARLAEAQAYKAIMDAQSRARDVEAKSEERASKIDQNQFKQVMDIFEQHNRAVSGNGEQ